MDKAARLAQLDAWLSRVLGGAAFTLAPASEDASFRRYFRVVAGGVTRIAMDAPPPQEDVRPYLHVAEVFRAAGVHVPQVYATDVEHGFLLLSDLGSTTYLAALDADSAHGLYVAALDALVAIQRASRPGVLPPYDRALLERELNLFPDWYVARHLGLELSAGQRAVLATAFERILANNLAQPPVYVHRDYHSRNLMVSEPNPGILDFQDAVYGPVTYDLVSLLRDAYISWDEARVIDWAARYWERARADGVPVGTDFGAFYRDFEWMGVQRQIKVLGIFARLCHRDGKAAYLDDMPLVLRYLRGACGRYDELRPLAGLLDELHGVGRRAGYTF